MENSLENPKTSAAWSAVWAMSMCAMVLIASEFLPVSLLTPLASELGISEGQAGQSISISGLFAVITSLFLTPVIGKIDRRNLLLFFTLLMIISGAVVAFASNAFILMVGRAIIGMCIGGFWSMSAATVMRLVPEQSVPKAIAILNGGNAFATTIAAPLGSYLGSVIGWRGAFFCVVPVALIAFIWQWATLPKLPADHRKDKVSSFSVFKLLKRKDVLLGMLSVSAFFMGQFVLFTYLRPFLENVTGVTIAQLSSMLLGMGVCGLAGTILIGKVVDKHLSTLLVIIPFLMLLNAFALLAFGHSVFAAYVLLAFWGFLGTSAPVAWWTWLSKTVTDDTEAGGGLMVAVIQVAITLGAAVGGFLFDYMGYQITFSASAVILGVAVVLAIITTNSTRSVSISEIQNDFL